MRNILSTLTTLTLLGAGAALAQDNVDPAGEWEWEVDFQGQVLAGTMEITGENGTWSGTMSSDMGTADIISVEVDGDMIILILSAEGMEIILELDVEGEEFTGTGSAGGEQFQISGRRTGG